MAKNTTIKKGGVTVERAEQKPVIISHIVQQSIDRTPKDIADFVRELESAESVYFPTRAGLYDIYHRIIMDGALTGVWDNKRVAKACNKVIKFKANEKEVEPFNELIASERFRAFIELRMQQNAWGVKGAEFIVGPKFNWHEIPNKHINTFKKVITKHQYDQTGTSYVGLQNVMVLGSGLGFLYKVAPLILYKQGNWGDWASFIEKYGQPFQQFTYDIYDERSRQEAFELAKNSGNSLAIVVPKQIEFEVKDGKQTNADGKLQSNFKNDLDEQIRFIVVGNNLTSTNHGGGSYSLGEVQKDDQDDITSNDLKDILETLNSDHFLSILKSYGYPVEGGKFIFDEPVKAEDLKADTEVDKFLVDTVGLPLDHDYFYNKYGRPKPANYNELVQKQEEERQARLKPQQQEQQQQEEQNPVTGKKKPPAKKEGFGKLRALYAAAIDFFYPAPSH